MAFETFSFIKIKERNWFFSFCVIRPRQKDLSTYSGKPNEWTGVHKVCHLTLTTTPNFEALAPPSQNNGLSFI